ncbi:hypothetical protein HYS94_04615 [Candidatus Daviesbacteria bacterium]|nr:hypothetical protein [Candidatus Daviesbacteria bacterium]
MNIQKAIAGTAMFAALALNVTPAFAQVPLPSERPSFPPRPSILPNPSILPVPNPSAHPIPPNGDRIAERCAQVKQHIDRRLELFGQNRETFINNAQHLHERVLRIVDKAEAMGLDTTQVRADLRSLGDKVNKLKEDNQSFIAKLQAAKDVNCVENPDQFRTALQEANAQFQVVISDFRDIKDYFKNTIKPDIRALIDQLPHPSPSPSPTPTASP